MVPLGLAFIFNSIFSGISGTSDVISLGVVNADHGAVSQQFTGQVLPAVGRSGLITIHAEATLERARALAANGTLAAGAGIFLGTLFRNEQQAIGVSLLLGLGLAALGGCMVPLEVFSPTMRRVAHITPHAWANDAFAKLVGHGASIGGILPQLGILAAYAAILLTLAAWRLRRVLSA